MLTSNYTPIHNLSQVFGSLFDRAQSGEQCERAYCPKSYLTEKDGVYKLEVELPGVRKEDIQVNVESNLLKIAAVRKRADDEVKYEREFQLSQEVDSANIQAANENGVLTLTLARKPEAQSKQVTIQ